MELKQRILEVNLRPMDIVTLTNGGISLSLASQWLSSFKKRRSISKPVALLLWRLCAEKEHSVTYTPTLTLPQIKKLAKPVTDVVGIYFLLAKGKVVYVGKSLNVYRRINEHSKDKEFDSNVVIKCDAGELERLEAYYINLIKPPLNRAIPNIYRFESRAKKIVLDGKELSVAFTDKWTTKNIKPPINGFLRKDGVVFAKFEDSNTVYDLGCLNPNEYIIHKNVVYTGDFTQLVGGLMATNYRYEIEDF